MVMIAPEGIKLQAYKSSGEIDTFAHVWDTLRTQEQRFILSFAETKIALQESELEFCFITIEDKCSTFGIACFFNRKATKDFSIGGRLSFRLSVRETRLYYS